MKFINLFDESVEIYIEIDSHQEKGIKPENFKH